MIPITWAIGAAGALAVLGFAGGWQARAIIAERDALRGVAAVAAGFQQAAERAAKAADDYAKRRDALQPEIRVIRTEGRTIVRELDRCPLPVDAGRLLDRAADAADGTARLRTAADAARAPAEQQ